MIAPATALSLRLHSEPDGYTSELYPDMLQHRRVLIPGDSPAEQALAMGLLRLPGRIDIDTAPGCTHRGEMCLAEGARFDAAGRVRIEHVVYFLDLAEARLRQTPEALAEWDAAAEHATPQRRRMLERALRGHYSWAGVASIEWDEYQGRYVTRWEFPGSGWAITSGGEHDLPMFGRVDWRDRRGV